MQTFLPYADFEQTAKSLDMKRLGKQRVETMQIMNAILNPEYGWQNHPAVNMWRGYESTLLEYQEAICNEWTSRGYKDTCLQKTIDLMSNFKTNTARPGWIGDYDFHLSHQSNLLRKLPEHYSQYFVNVADDLPYIWPGEQ